MAAGTHPWEGKDRQQLMDQSSQYQDHAGAGRDMPHSQWMALEDR